MILDKKIEKNVTTMSNYHKINIDKWKSLGIEKQIQIKYLKD